MRLSYDGQERTETDIDVIQTLMRKGWEVIPDAPPMYSPQVLLLGRIQQRANEIIYGRYPQTIQNNLQARFSELLYLERQRELTPEEATEQANLLAVYDWVRNVRTYAAQLTNLANVGEPIDVEAAWPME